MDNNLIRKINLFDNTVLASAFILGLSYVVRFLLTICIANILNQSNFGEYSWGISALSWCVVLIHYGCDYFLLNKLALYKEGSQLTLVRVIIFTEKRIKNNYGILITTILILSLLISHVKAFDNYLIPLFILATSTVFSGLSLVNAVILRTYDNIVISQFIENLSQSFLLLMILGIVSYLANFQLSIEAIAAFYSFSWFLTYLLSKCYRRKKINLNTASNQTSPPDANWTKDRNYIVIGIIGWILLGRSDVVLLAFFVTPEEIALYFVALRLGEVLLFPSTLAYYYWSSKISLAINQQKIKEAQSIIRRTTIFCCLCSAALFILSVIFLEPIVRLFGLNPEQLPWLYLLFLTVFLIKASSGLLRPLFYILNDNKYFAKVQWGIGALFAVTFIIITHIYGIIGGATLFAMSEIIFIIILMFRLNVRHGLRLI